MPGSAPAAPPDPAERTDERPRASRRRAVRAPTPDPAPTLDPPFSEPDDRGDTLTSLERELLAVVREGQGALLGELRAIRGDVRLGARVLFLHTGGLPGLLADPEPFRDMVRA